MFVDPSGLSASLEWQLFLKEIRNISSSVAGFLGAMCGWVRGWHMAGDDASDAERYASAILQSAFYGGLGAFLGYHLGPAVVQAVAYNQFATGIFLTIAVWLTIDETQEITSSDLSTQAKTDIAGICIILPWISGAAGVSKYAGSKLLQTLRNPRIRAAIGRLFRFGGTPNRNNPVNLSTEGKTAEDADVLREYARRANQWLDQNGPQTIKSTQGALRREASAAAQAERLRAARAGQPYTGQAGHVPDTAVTGQANPPAGWLDMPGTTNQSAGGPLGSRIGQRIDHFTVNGEIP